MVKLVTGGGEKEKGGPSVSVRRQAAKVDVVLPPVERFERQALVNPEFVEGTTSPLNSALWAHTAKMNELRDKFDEEEEHHLTYSADYLARKIKACSLFPNIYEKAPHHRTFPKVATEGAESSSDGEMKKRKGNEYYQAGSEAF